MPLSVDLLAGSDQLQVIGTQGVDAIAVTSLLVTVNPTIGGPFGGPFPAPFPAMLLVPYDEMIRQMIAADELYPDDPAKIRATVAPEWPKP